MVSVVDDVPWPVLATGPVMAKKPVTPTIADNKKLFPCIVLMTNEFHLVSL